MLPTIPPPNIHTTSRECFSYETGETTTKIIERLLVSSDDRVIAMSGNDKLSVTIYGPKGPLTAKYTGDLIYLNDSERFHIMPVTWGEYTIIEPSHFRNPTTMEINGPHEKIKMALGIITITRGSTIQIWTKRGKATTIVNDTHIEYTI